jgi:hypothetical protein
MSKLAILFFLCTIPAHATAYFLNIAGNGGSDANNGTSSGTPWLSPNHAVNCGDTITAAASTAYAAANFASGKWGTVTCAGNNNVAILKCATFDACKITTSANTSAMQINTNYWAVYGWEATALTGTSAGCFQARPSSSSTSIHHIIFANDICNGAENGGFSAYNNGSAGVDYIVYVGNIAYNSAQTSSPCTSGFNIYQPNKSDSASGTHMYVAGNFSWSNLEPNPCNGGNPTDGEGIIMDTFDGSQGGGNDYDQQAVIYNNLILGNGGRGIEVFNNASGSTHAPVYIYQNTTWGNELDTNQIFSPCGEYQFVSALKITMNGKNLGMTTASGTCNSTAPYVVYVGNGDSSLTVSGNFLYSAAGRNTNATSSPGFSFGTNTTGTNPGFASPSVPGAPSCGSNTSVVDCMSTVISNFTPSGAAVGYGYQTPPMGNVIDPLFPAWLCNVNLPSGLVAEACGSSSVPTSVFSIL